MTLEQKIARLREYADSLDSADVHGDMGLSMTHTEVSDAMREAADDLSRFAAPPAPPAAPQSEEQRFIADCAKEGMYRQLVEAVGDALDGQLSEEQAKWFPVARGVQQQRVALDKSAALGHSRLNEIIEALRKKLPTDLVDEALAEILSPMSIRRPTAPPAARPEPLFTHLGWLLAKVMKDATYPEARVIWESWCDFVDGVPVAAPPAAAEWQPTTALELLTHIQGNHVVVNRVGSIECSCGATWKLPAPPVAVDLEKK